MENNRGWKDKRSEVASLTGRSQSTQAWKMITTIKTETKPKMWLVSLST